jgi:hypothetical protein
MRRHIRVLIPLLAARVAACATPALYQPMRGDDVGYGEQRLEDNRYRVWFAGNSATPRETVENYVLYRAAELTLEKGYDHFVLSDRTTEGEGRDSRVSFGIGGFRFGGSGGISIGVGTGIGVGDPKYFGQADVVLMKGPKPADNANAFDARQIKAGLEPSIVRTAPE